jgi:hypothetical protein
LYDTILNERKKLEKKTRRSFKRKRWY